MSVRSWIKEGSCGAGLLSTTPVGFVETARIFDDMLSLLIVGNYM